MNELPVIPVAVCANEAFAPGLKMAILSSFYSSSNRYHYQYTVLDGGLSDTTKLEIESKLSLIGNSQKKSYELNFVQPDEALIAKLPTDDEMAKNHPKRVSSWLAFARFFLQEILEEDFVIYLDSDILCLAGIHQFYEAWDGKKAVVGVQDPIKYLRKDRPKSLPKVESNHQYLNSGLVLMNLVWMRKELPLSAVHQFLSTHPPEQIKYHDQTILNNFLNGDFSCIARVNNLVLRVCGGAMLPNHWKDSNLHFIGRTKPWMERHQTVVTRILADYLYWKASEFYQIAEVKKPTKYKEEDAKSLRKKAFFYQFFNPERAKVYKEHFFTVQNYDKLCREVDAHFANSVL